MRIFAALQPSPDFAAALSRLQQRLMAAGVSGRYLDPAFLHLTLAFVGEWPEDISALLPRVDSPFSLRLTHIGLFPEARVLWVGTAPCPALNDLAERVRSALGEAAVPFDPKPFVPHITLMRKPCLPEGFSISGFPVEAVELTVDRVCLYRSARGETGMEYTVIGRGPSAAEA